MRLIDAGAIIKRAEESFKNAGLHGEDYRKFKKWLRTTPTIDAVEVVRCKDCKWWGGNKNTEHNNHICNRALIQEVDYWTRADDYCSHGKRKGGDEA